MTTEIVFVPVLPAVAADVEPLPVMVAVCPLTNS